MLSGASFWGLGLSLGGLACLLSLGCYFHRGIKKPEDFFLGGRRIPSWAGAFSIAASEVSVMTVLGLPAVAYHDDWSYLAFFAGSAAARLAAAAWLVRPLYRGGSTTVYEYLRDRFDERVQFFSAALFLASRLLSAGVRLMALAVAVSVLTGLPPAALIAGLCAASAVYSALGGLGAVVWGNLLQSAFFFAAGLGTLAFISGHVQGGPGEILHVAREAGRLAVWPASGGAYALLGGLVGGVSALAGDQETVQRLFSMRSEGSAQRALALSVPVSLAAFSLYLAVGTGLFVFYEQHPEMALPSDPGNVYPHFSVQMMPAWLSGLLIATAVMASADAPLIALSTSLVVDFLRPLGLAQRRSLKAGRWAVVGFAAVLGLAAWFLLGHRDWLGWALRIGGAALGPAAMAVGAGVFTKWRCRRACLFGAAAATCASLALLALSEAGAVVADWNLLLAGVMALTPVLVRASAPRLDGPQSV